MPDLEAILCELEWQRLRYRMMHNHVRSMVLGVGTWAVAAALKFAPR
jgi:hypothetical protein